MKTRDLTAKIRIPNGISGQVLMGFLEYAYQQTRDTMPFKTGWMSRYCFQYEITLDGNYIELYIRNDECPYAYYLEYDIPRTRGFWERSIRIFTAYLNGKYKKAKKLSKKTEDLYGLKFNNAREIDKLLRKFEKLDKEVYNAKKR